MNLYQKFEVLANQDPQAVALIAEGKLMSRKTFMAQVEALATGMHVKGVKSGDVVGIALPNTPTHLMSLLAVARLGAASLPLHPRSAPMARRRLVTKYGAKFVLTGAVPANAAQIQGLRFLQVDEVLLAGQGGFEAKALPAQPDKDTIARISLTSGTTGEPSAMAYTHEHWVSRVERTSVGLDASTRLLVGSLHLTLGNLLAFSAMLAGGLVVFNPLKGTGNVFMETIRLYGVTHANLVPSGIKAMAAMAPNGAVAFPSIKQLRVVGGALSDHLFQLAYSRLTPNLMLPYGTSEVGLIAMATTQMLKDHPDHTGKVTTGGEIEVVDADDRVLGPNELGELRVKVPLMLQSYYKDEARTKLKFRDGWFYTSDMGRLSEEGFLKIEGRSDDRINIAGTKLFPEQVERVLISHPAILESAIFTVPEPLIGKKMVAAIVLAEGATLNTEQLVELCRSRKLADKTPAEYFFCAELPRNASGKLLRGELQKLLTPQSSLFPLASVKGPSQ